MQINGNTLTVSDDEMRRIAEAFEAGSPIAKVINDALESRNPKSLRERLLEALPGHTAAPIAVDAIQRRLGAKSPGDFTGKICELVREGVVEMFDSLCGPFEFRRAAPVEDVEKTCKALEDNANYIRGDRKESGDDFALWEAACRTAARLLRRRAAAKPDERYERLLTVAKGAIKSCERCGLVAVAHELCAAISAFDEAKESGPAHFGDTIDALSEARSAAEVLAAFSMRCVAALRNAHNAIQREAWQEGPSIEEAASALQQQIDAPTAPLDRVAGAFRTVEKWRKG